MSNIQQQLNDRLKAAMRARDAQTLGFVRMLKAKMTETTTAKGFSGEVDDALWLKVISSYAKQQKKALEQYQAAGEAGAEHAAGIEWELAACDEFLPKKASDAEVQAWIDEAIASLGGKENAKFGAVMGKLMKAHKDVLDAGKVRGMINAALAG